MRWRLLQEKNRPEIVQMVGVMNAVPDAISRLDMDPTCKATRS